MLAEEGVGAVDRGRGVVDAQGDRGDGEAVQELERVGEALVLEVEHDADVALAVQLDVLGAVAVGAAKAQGLEHGAERGGAAGLVDELQELDALDLGDGAGAGAQAQLLVEPAERAHAVDRGLARRFSKLTTRSVSANINGILALALDPAPNNHIPIGLARCWSICADISASLRTSVLRKFGTNN